MWVTIVGLYAVSLLPVTTQGYAGLDLSGDYVGLERMANLTPEDKDTQWFHENTLVVRGNQAILDMVPVEFRHGKKAYSASEGGFMTYRGSLLVRNGRVFMALRMFESDYIEFAEGEAKYKEIKEYLVKHSAGRIEIDGVQYRRTALSKPERNHLLELLDRVPLNP